MKLLIAIPLKNENEGRNYLERSITCEATWLKDVRHDAYYSLGCDDSVFYKFFTDAELGLDPKSETIRPMRTKLMAKYALENGYDYVFRTDTDAYVWVARLLRCGYEQHDYMGWCLEYPKHLEVDRVKRTAHGGIGFFLSRKAMQVVVDAPPHKQNDGIYWGDIWTGEVLGRAGIYCHRDTRFLDGSNGPDEQHHGNIFAHELPDDHQYISIHPVPVENMIEIHKKFANLPAETTPPEKQIWFYDIEWNYGQKRPDICDCDWCS